MPIDYLQKILTAKVYDVAVETPLDLAPTLSRRLGNRVWLKREDQQSVFSFKLRGAYNKMAHMSAPERTRGVIAASAGNHAQGVALAAQSSAARRRSSCRSPRRTSRSTPSKPRARRSCCMATRTPTPCEGARVAAHSGATFVHPYDDPE
jgi:threonine dehydratase